MSKQRDCGQRTYPCGRNGGFHVRGLHQGSLVASSRHPLCSIEHHGTDDLFAHRFARADRENAKSIRPEVSDLPEPVGTNRLPPIGVVAFGQRLHLRQSRLPVGMTGRNDEGTLFTCPEENTPCQAGEPHHIVTVLRALDVPGTVHPLISGMMFIESSDLVHLSQTVNVTSTLPARNLHKVGALTPTGSPRLVGRYCFQTLRSRFDHT